MRLIDLLAASAALSTAAMALPMIKNAIRLVSRADTIFDERLPDPTPPIIPDESDPLTSDWLETPPLSGHSAQRVSVRPDRVREAAVHDAEDVIPKMTIDESAQLRGQLIRSSVDLYLWLRDFEAGRYNSADVSPTALEAVRLCKTQLDKALDYLLSYETLNPAWTNTVNRILDEADFHGDSELENTYRALSRNRENSGTFEVRLPQSFYNPAPAVEELSEEVGQMAEDLSIAQLERELPQIDKELQKGAKAVAGLLEDVALHL